MIDGLSVSNSEISTWQGCRRRWMLRYFYWFSTPEDRIVPTGVMYLGTRVHTALEYWYGHGADPLLVLKLVYRHAEEGRDEYVLAELHKEQDTANKMVEGYVEWVRETGVDEGLTIIGAERDVTVAGPHGVGLRARLDLKVRRDHDGATMFIDHKTVGDLNPTWLELDGQMRFYALVDRLDGQEQGEVRTDGGLYNMLKRSKRTARANPPFYKREEVRFNDATLRATWAKVSTVVSEIKSARERLSAGEDHLSVAFPTPSRDCSWRCEYASVCPLFDDGSRAWEMTAEQYAKTDPYGYYQPSELPELLALRKKEVTADG